MKEALAKHHTVHDDLVPKVQDQAAEYGWKAGVFSFGKAEAPNIDHFNPGIVERDDGLWLIVRRALFEDRTRFGKNNVWAFKLGGEDGITPQSGIKAYLQPSQDNEQFEDPRAIYFGGRTWIGACNFVWYDNGGKNGRGRWTGAHQILVPVDDKWRAVSRFDPNYGKNGGGLAMNTGHEKNWLWFFHEQKPHLVYAGPPNHEVVEFGEDMRQRNVFKSSCECPWTKGVIRGGTPPVRVGDEYWSFFHSSTDWKPPYRRYYMGCYAFSAKPPFEVTKITREPLLIGSQNDYWQPRKPLVVFPCGALLKNDNWFVTYGLNDLKCGHCTIPHEDITILAENV